MLPHSGLSKPEWDELKSLQKKQKVERDCAVEIDRESRTAAYERYFERKPDDYSGHNFAKWSDAGKYLGRKFYELLAEERFDEEQFAGSAFLKRPATANAPAISLADSRYKPKVVTWINLVSTPNPSQEFTQHLVKSLESAWDKRSGGNGTTEWLWDKKEFSARLSFEPVAAEGPFLGLVINSK